jgi:hypothetical protein
MNINSEPLTTDALIAAVKAHANDQYTQGWDVVVETMTDAELAEQITTAAARTTADAIAALTPLVQGWLERTGPHWPDTYCTIHPGVRLTSVFPEEEPSECTQCDHEADQPLPDLWWDDASYISYQSRALSDNYDPSEDYPKIALLTDHTDDVCDGSTGYGRKHRCPTCTAQDAEAPPF